MSIGPKTGLKITLYHNWGDEDVDWEGINDAGYFIADYLSKYGRIHIGDVKEKWGEVRVSCYFGHWDLYTLLYPKRYQVRGPLKFMTNIRVPKFVNDLFIVPYQRLLYRRAYRLAIRRWPHLREEILGGADWDELLIGL